MSLDFLCKGVKIEGITIIPQHYYNYEGITAIGVAVCPCCMEATCNLTGLKTSNDLARYTITYKIKEE